MLRTKIFPSDLIKKNLFLSSCNPFLLRNLLLASSEISFRYYGWYSNKSRGLRKKQGIAKSGDRPIEEAENIEIIDVTDYKPKPIPCTLATTLNIQGLII